MAETKVPLCGGWFINIIVKNLPEEIDKAFELLNKGVGASYKPLAQLATKVVAGTWYAALGEQTILDKDNTKNYVVVYFLVNLEQKIEGISVEQVHGNIVMLPDGQIINISDIVRALPPGYGTEDNPYIISNENDWNIFAESVNTGYSYAGEFIKLDADIYVSQTVGKWKSETEYSPFSGTFDGDGHTITAKMEEPDTEVMAVFSCIKGATIKNLTVAGSITGYLDTAGLVGCLMGSRNKIEKCVVTATINGDLYTGGISGYWSFLRNVDYSDITIDNCVFKGLLNGRTKGAFIVTGKSPNYRYYVSNSLYILQEYQDTEDFDLVQNSESHVIVTECYKTANIGRYGIQAYLTRPSDGGYIEMTAVDGTKFYVQAFASGSGTETDPYIINNEDDWNRFANFAKTYEGEYIKLNADITVSQKAGVMKFFAGTFDGDGHTITADITDKISSGTALFQYIQGATIKNLTVAGEITGNWYSAGLVGRSTGSGNKIERCIVAATINGNSHIGGILGYGEDSEITIDNCVFKGLLNGDDITKGVFLGWGNNGGTKTVKNCLYILQKDQNKEYLDLAKMCDDCTVSVTDCYKTADIGKYGTLVYLEKPSSGNYIEKTAIDGTIFYVPT